MTDILISQQYMYVKFSHIPFFQEKMSKQSCEHCYALSLLLGSLEIGSKINVESDDLLNRYANNVDGRNW